MHEISRKCTETSIVHRCFFDATGEWEFSLHAWIIKSTWTCKPHPSFIGDSLCWSYLLAIWSINKISKSKNYPAKTVLDKTTSRITWNESSKPFVLIFRWGDCPSPTEAHALLARLWEKKMRTENYTKWISCLFLQTVGLFPSGKGS